MRENPVGPGDGLSERLIQKMKWSAESNPSTEQQVNVTRHIRETNQWLQRSPTQVLSSKLMSHDTFARPISDYNGKACLRWVQPKYWAASWCHTTHSRDQSVTTTARRVSAEFNPSTEQQVNVTRHIRETNQWLQQQGVSRSPDVDHA